MRWTGRDGRWWAGEQRGCSTHIKCDSHPETASLAPRPHHRPPRPRPPRRHPSAHAMKLPPNQSEPRPSRRRRCRAFGIRTGTKPEGRRRRPSQEFASSNQTLRTSELSESWVACLCRSPSHCTVVEFPVRIARGWLDHFRSSKSSPFRYDRPVSACHPGFPLINNRFHGAVAQLGERSVRNAKVRGSRPLSSTDQT